MLTAFLPMLLMQVGPGPTSSPVSAVPPELRDRPARNAPMLDRAPSAPAIATCLETARTNPDKAIELAQEWVARTAGEQRAAGRHCLGVAAGNAGRLHLAAEAFQAARDEASDQRFRARMGALAGSALLDLSQDAQALAVLERAAGEARGDPLLEGAIALDRAAALVALRRSDEASKVLAEARTAAPGDAQVWLLSATLARRTEDLSAAQTFIEQAAALDPRDAAIGLEAGVIAALGGRDEAAIKSFESVIEASPGSPQANSARIYLDTLRPR